MTWFYFVGECVKRNNTYLHVLSSWRNQVPGSLPFLSMYARRVLQGVAIKQCVLSKGNLFVKHHKVRKDLWITSTTALVPLGMFPEKRYALANSPCTRAAYSLVYFAHTHTNPLYGFTALVIYFMLCSKPTLYLRPLVVDLSSWAKYGRPYCAWSAPSITVLIASVDAAACALLKWYMPRSSLTYKFKQQHKLVSDNRHGISMLCVTWQNVRQLT